MADLKQVNLLSLLTESSSGVLVIPDFQRDFVWKLKQIEELINSIINNYFIGSILLLESPIQNKRFAPRLIRGVSHTQVNLQEHDTIRYILDGQQRITSLYYAFFEPNVTLSDETDFICKFYMHPDTMDIFGLMDPEDMARRLRLGADAKKKFYEIYNDIYGVDIKNLPTMSIFRSQQALNEYIDNNPRLTPTFKEKIISLFTKINACTIPIITLPVNTSDDDIVNIFERINRTGTPLGIFELAVARYYPLGINLNVLKDKIKGSLFLKILDGESILKAMALSKDFEPKPQNLIKLIDTQKSNSENLAEFYTLWDSAVKYLGKALDRIRHNYGAPEIKVGKRTIDLIPYTSMIVPMAVMLYEIERHGNSASLFEKVDLWYWVTVFSQKYTHGVEAKSYNDVRIIRDWFMNATSKPDFTCNFEHIRTEMLKSARSSALGKGFYNLLILNNCRDLLTGQEIKLSECHVDHIFPSSRFGRAADSIFNLTLLDRNTNQKKKDKLPDEFITECLESHGNDDNKLMKTLESHFISTKSLEAIRSNNLDAFIQSRADLFIDKFKAKVI